MATSQLKKTNRKKQDDDKAQAQLAENQKQEDNKKKNNVTLTLRRAHAWILGGIQSLIFGKKKTEEEIAEEEQKKQEKSSRKQISCGAKINNKSCNITLGMENETPGIFKLTPTQRWKFESDDESELSQDHQAALTKLIKETYEATMKRIAEENKYKLLPTNNPDGSISFNFTNTDGSQLTQEQSGLISRNFVNELNRTLSLDPSRNTLGITFVEKFVAPENKPKHQPELEKEQPQSQSQALRM